MTTQEYRRILNISLNEKETKYILHALGISKFQLDNPYGTEATRNHLEKYDKNVEHLIFLGFMRKYRDYLVVRKAGMKYVHYLSKGGLKVRNFEDVYE